VGRAVWRTIVEAGSCQDSDALVLERYCRLHDRRAALLALVGTEGYVVPGVKQPSTAHPAIRLAHDIEAQMTRLESVLALNPSARARLGLAAAGDDPPADFLRRSLSPAGLSSDRRQPGVPGGCPQIGQMLKRPTKRDASAVR
jgi:P27 family predicted phage terminase small subunit